MGKGDRAVVILAAGEGKRMKSNIPKVLHKLNGKPLVKHVIDVAKSVEPEKIVIVIGHLAQAVKNELKDEPVEFAVQEERLGTADAVKSARSLLADFDGSLFVLCGDVPLIRPATLYKMLLLYEEKNCAVVLLTVEMDDPSGYGRIIRNGNGDVIGNVEDRDANQKQKKIREINSGIYLFNSRFLFGALGSIKSDNKQGEEYLPDIIETAVKQGKKVSAIKLENDIEISGVNSQEDLEKLALQLKIGMEI